MIEVAKYDTAEFLNDREDCVEYLKAVTEFEDMTPELFFFALGNIARSKGFEDAAQASGIDAASLRAGLHDDMFASSDALLPIIQALGLRISVTPADRTSSDPLSADTRSDRDEQTLTGERRAIYV